MSLIIYSFSPAYFIAKINHHYYWITIVLKLTTFFCLIILSLSSFANEEEHFLCSAYYVKDITAKIEAPASRDKFKHCSASCMLVLRCGTIDPYSAGLLKELLDMMGMGNPEMADIRANVTGIKLARNKTATTDNQCLLECGKYY